ncbi:MAG: DNA recombination protein RmuC [Micavibrio sp.]|nr:DNA recombination protein RmuC [Micavibrio sp.]
MATFTPDIMSILMGGAAGLAVGIIFALALGSGDKAKIDAANENLNKERERIADLEKRLQYEVQKSAGLEAERRLITEQIGRHKSDLEHMEKKFALQFENLANKIFDEKTSKFKTESAESLGQLLNPLRDRLQEFHKKVDDSFGEQAKENFSLRKEIENIVSVNKQMSVQTESLTKALKGDVKAQGNWGEVMLEKILEDSGLRKDTDYYTQGADMGLKHVDSGRTLKPDVVVNLPDKKHIIIDAKVSLTHYERYCAADNDDARAALLKEFINSIRAHVAGLEQRRYQDTDKLGTPDLVLMFMPIEGAYSLAVQKDPELHSSAWDKKIVIVSPVTLFATLRTISSLWRIEQQNRNTQEIARQGGALFDKIAGFLKDMEDLGKRLSAAQDVYGKAYSNLTTGTGNIRKRAETLQALGVKTSKALPHMAGDEADEGGEEASLLKSIEKPGETA